MSKVHELTRKEMKGPDKFQQAAVAAAGWLTGHQKQIAAGVVVALGVVAMGVGISAWLGHRATQAGAELAKVFEAIQSDISPVAVPGSNRRFFKTEEEQQRAIVTAAAEVRSRFPSDEAAATAALASGDAELRLGEWDKSVADYQAFLASAGRDNSLRFAALDGMAHAYEGKGDLPQAVQSWERLGSEVPFRKDRAELERARLLVKMGRADDAKKLLTGFDDAFKESTLKTDARDLLNKLGGK
jgi:tetratricopeptide (TPR) repeat protein